MTMGKGRRRCYNDFSLKMSSSLSKRWVCCVVENLSSVFLFKWPLILLWVMRVYIVWVKGKKVTLKNPPGREFCRYLAGQPFSRDTRETDSLARLFSFQHVLLKWLLHGLASRETLTKSTCSSNTCSILHKLNTKPNTIESHKIQGTKLKQLQHFLSWNKANIKYSCKSQLYTVNEYPSYNLIIKALSLLPNLP